MAKNEHSWFSKLTGTIPNTQPPPSKREIKDIVEASRGSGGGFKNMSDREIVKWARNKHQGFEGVSHGNQFGGVDVRVADSGGFVKIIHYDNLGNYAGSSGRGR
jgi:hypothetical protein